MNGPGDPIKIKGRRNKKKWQKDQVGDPVKAAKKEIRKGGTVDGGSNVLDTFGSRHGYNSKLTNTLASSKLVTRKKVKNIKSAAKDELKGYRGKENRQGFKSDEFTTDMGMETAQDGNKYRKQEIKRIKQTAKEDVKKTKRGNRATRKLLKNEGKLNQNTSDTWTGNKEFKSKTGFDSLMEQENAIAVGQADWKGHKPGHSLNKVQGKWRSMVAKKP